MFRGDALSPFVAFKHRASFVSLATSIQNLLKQVVETGQENVHLFIAGCACVHVEIDLLVKNV